ncbi:MAG: putative archaeal flagellar protein D/E [uncultured archaeon A07HB70]|nr:MAG: putative archaeal flagellar protein D/E [uncultured archaeon A07HB70]
MQANTASRPYLSGGIAPGQMETALRWARYLANTFGTGGALCSLRYYERIGWIDEATRRGVERQLRGLSTEELHSKKYDDPGCFDGPLSPLSGTPFGSHARSLEFVATLADDDIESRVVHADAALRSGDEIPEPIARDRPAER